MRLSAKPQKITSRKTTRPVANASAPQLSRPSASQHSPHSQHSQHSQRIAPASAPAAIRMSVLSKNKRKDTTLMNIPDDILTVLYKNLNISQLMIMYRLNTSFSTKKGAMIDVEILDLTNVRIDAEVIKFIEDNINKLKIKKIILDNISFVDDEVFNTFILSISLRTLSNQYKNVEELVITNVKNLNISQLMILYRLNTSFSTKKMVMNDVETLDLTNVRIDAEVIKFIEDNINKLKIKKIILDNTTFADDEVFNAFILSIRLRHLPNHYKNVKELVITNFDALDGKVIDPGVETINYFLTLIENIGFFSNLKKLTITYTDIIAQLDWDINGRFAFAESFVDMLGYLENLQHLIFDYNNVEPEDLQEITNGVRKINNKRKRKDLHIIKQYEQSHNNTFEL